MRRKLLGIFISAAIAISMVSTPMAALAAPPRAVGRAAQILSANQSSPNWAGYVATGKRGSVTSVSGTWVVPKVSAPSRKNVWEYSSTWIGIDGWDNGTVQQLGTQQCVRRLKNGTEETYYAVWFEMYPAPMLELYALQISPGDTISAEIHYAGKVKTGSKKGNDIYGFSLMDVTTGENFLGTVTSPPRKRTSAEWIHEAPTDPATNKLLPLAKSTPATFTSSYATVNGTRSRLSLLKNVAIDMRVSKHGAIKATTVPGFGFLLNSLFSVNWKHR
jgi:hypothetical protein